YKDTMHLVTCALYYRKLLSVNPRQDIFAHFVNLHKLINIMGITCGKLSGYYLDNCCFIHRPVLSAHINSTLPGCE
ncbi:MAG: hypothetical protein ACRC36_20415, partial [Lacrimispora sphenoides]